MALKECIFCESKVPVNGQCKKCGFIDGLKRQPTDEEFSQARIINKEHDYEQFSNIDMILLELENKSRQ